MTKYYNNEENFKKLLRKKTKQRIESEYAIWHKLAQIKKGKFDFLVLATTDTIKKFPNKAKQKWFVYLRIIYDINGTNLISHKFFEKSFDKRIYAYCYYYSLKKFIEKNYIHAILKYCNKNKISFK
ncbi:MAG: hypothetical protein IJN13_00565 [Bacilli bacterium]|nr:hypothetical protein [Bacilli bacterium]